MFLGHFGVGFVAKTAAPRVSLGSLTFVIGLWFYLRTTAPRDAVGYWALWSFVVVLLLVYAANLLAPPPPSVMALAWAGQAQWLLVAWAYWIDSHRRVAP